MKNAHPAPSAASPAAHGLRILTIRQTDDIDARAYRIRRFAAIVGAAVQAPRHQGIFMAEALEGGIYDLCRDMETLSQEIITILAAAERIGGVR